MCFISVFIRRFIFVTVFFFFDGQWPPLSLVPTIPRVLNPNVTFNPGQRTAILNGAFHFLI